MKIKLPELRHPKSKTKKLYYHRKNLQKHFNTAGRFFKYKCSTNSYESKTTYLFYQSPIAFLYQPQLWKRIDLPPCLCLISFPYLKCRYLMAAVALNPGKATDFYAIAWYNSICISRNNLYWILQFAIFKIAIWILQLNLVSMFVKGYFICPTSCNSCRYITLKP